MLMQTLGNSTVACDRAITCEFDQFLKKRQPDRPFWGFILWGFILYDAVHKIIVTLLHQITNLSNSLLNSAIVFRLLPIPIQFPMSIVTTMPFIL